MTDASAGILLQAVAVDYRRPFYRALEELADTDFMLVSGHRTFDPSVRAVEPGVRAAPARNRFFLGNAALWQSGVILRAVRAPWVVAEMNPRILSTWIVLAWRRARGRPVVLWGHAFPRRGPSAWTDILRRPLRSLAHVVVVYSEPEATELAARQPTLRVLAAPNALYRRGEITPDVGPPAVRVDGFVCVGRLVPSKRPDLLLEAFARLPAGGSGPLLHFVGSGPMAQDLRAKALELGLLERVLFHGHTSSATELSAIYARVVASVSPGYVGLSLIQSLSFGVPQILADRERHSPEIAAATSHNSVAFRSGDVEHLAQCLTTVWEKRNEWTLARERIARDAARYSIESMAERIWCAVELARQAVGIPN